MSRVHTDVIVVPHTGHTPLYSLCSNKINNQKFKKRIYSTYGLQRFSTEPEDLGHRLCGGGRGSPFHQSTPRKISEGGRYAAFVALASLSVGPRWYQAVVDLFWLSDNVKKNVFLVPVVGNTNIKFRRFSLSRRCSRSTARYSSTAAADAAAAAAAAAEHHDDDDDDHIVSTTTTKTATPRSGVCRRQFPCSSRFAPIRCHVRNFRPKARRNG